MTHPYKDLEPRAYWRTAVSAKHFSELVDIGEKILLSPGDRVATAGSCFAQHIGRALKAGGMGYMDLELPPADLTPEEAQRHGFGIYSCRYGNIYTVRQLRQLAEEALGDRTPDEITWKRGDRYCDALRPSVDPVGHNSPDTIRHLRSRHLQKVRRMLETLDVFVFTLGLTEAWQLHKDQTVFPVCPGTEAGVFESLKYGFVNFRYPEIFADLVRFREILKSINGRARMILTVSPVSLAATASGKHILSANTYSKSTLRAVAGDVSEMFSDVAYFPSYEIITGHPMRATFFNSDLRTVSPYGVNYVMNHFFSTINREKTTLADTYDKLGVVCDEDKLAGPGV